MTGSLPAVSMPGGPRPIDVPVKPLADVAERVGAPVPDDAGDAAVGGVSLSSGAVRPRDLYAALPGSRVHGANFVAEAVERGAVAVLTDPAGAQLAAGCGLPLLVVPWPRNSLGRLAAWLYGSPADRITTLGVTGTNGKTTTTFLLDSALRAVGLRTGLVGTVEIRSGDRRVRSTGTTPEAPDLHALLAVMGQDGVDTCSLEISSHALDQHRVDGLVLDIAGFSNLSQDHLDYHHTMEEYFQVKARMFSPEQARRAVICIDDEWGRRLAGSVQIPVTTVATRPHAGADWQTERVRIVRGLPVAQVSGPRGEMLELACPLPGEYNLANALLALGMLVGTGLGAQTAADALALAGPVPGRMERVRGADLPQEPFAVVDYAHSPDAVSAALRTLSAGPRPLVVVLGAGGDRDRDKRELMGRAAAGTADVVVVTDDNPRSEDPVAIRAAVLAGARDKARTSGATVLEVPGRAEGIAEGLLRACCGTLLVAGRGHEQGQEIAGVRHPFDDREVLRDLILGAAPGPVPLPTASTPASVTSVRPLPEEKAP
jgi:UDP-N-acetylmuramoyl-L-alanyl-D-glutamate--2,6-diaminopimelate ligase